MEEGWRVIPVAGDSIPVAGDSREPFTQVRQKPQEPFVDFLARVQDAVAKTMGKAQGTNIVIKQIARSNCNPDCKKAMLGLRKDATIEEMV